MTEKRFDYTAYDDGTESIYDRKKDEYYFDGQLSEIEELLNDLSDENEQLKQKITELDDEINKLWDTCYHSLQFARREDIIIKRDDKGHYKIYSKNVIPRDSPIISITAPSVLFNKYILNHILESIDKIPPVQEKEVVTDD